MVTVKLSVFINFRYFALVASYNDNPGMEILEPVCHDSAIILLY